MDISQKRKRREARKLFLGGEIATNAEIARRVGLKPHTVGRYRKEEDWDGLRLKSDRRAAEEMAEKCSSERVSLNMQHYKLFEFGLGHLVKTMKGEGKFTVREVGELMAAIERAQRGQRLARGMSVTGETEEQIRAQAEADHRGLIDAFTDAVKEHIHDEDLRERIAQAVMAKFPGSSDDATNDGADAA